jgi:hypothetical protein
MYVDEIIGARQCGVLTTDQIFCIRQILERKYLKIRWKDSLLDKQQTSYNIRFLQTTIDSNLVIIKESQKLIISSYTTCSAPNGYIKNFMFTMGHHMYLLIRDVREREGCLNLLIFDVWHDHVVSQDVMRYVGCQVIISICTKY